MSSSPSLIIPLSYCVQLGARDFLKETRAGSVCRISFHQPVDLPQHYEREGLLMPHTRSENGYRWYGQNEIKRLEAIMAYRAFGTPVSNIVRLLDGEDDREQERILRGQLLALEHEIQKLRQQQKATVLLLKQPLLLEQNMVNKDRWVEIMKAAGFSEEDMKSWHQQFEKMEPQAHQEFLESLGIDKEEIDKIRGWSRQP
ncbi:MULTISPECIES: MerR family transcriptional regulator [unclassified Endozoicomonas]|uniref:MerR family transcriptional regulator n=1 Tax=unclassified Endozoicomonas TaxID=2644528 RepID=UPI00214847EA|nr:MULTISPECIES: MerR family transcriptional regulator [unclassified Endozoicomonas]